MKNKLSFTQNRSLAEAQVFALLRYRGSLTQADISQQAGISQPTTSRVLTSLHKKNLIEFKSIEKNTKSRSGKGGRNQRAAHVRSDAGYWIGISQEINGFHIALLNMHGQMLEKKTIEWVSQHDLNECLQQLATEIKNISKYRTKNALHILGAGMSVRGAVFKNRTLQVSTTPIFSNQPIGETLSGLLGGLPVHVIPTGRALISAEQLSREQTANHATQSTLFMYISEGIAFSPLFANNVLFSTHTNHLSWDFSHIVVDPKGPLCPCGREGCIEMLCSGKALATFLRTHCKDKKTARLSDFDLIHQNVELAQNNPKGVLYKELRRRMGMLADAVSTFLQFFGPDQLLLGGWVLNDNPWLAEQFIELLKTKLPEDLRGSLEFSKSRLDEFGGAIGAAEFACQQVLNEPLLQVIED